VPTLHKMIKYESMAPGNFQWRTSSRH